MPKEKESLSEIIERVEDTKMFSVKKIKALQTENKDKDVAIKQLEENIGALHQQLALTQKDYNEAQEENMALKATIMLRENTNKKLLESNRLCHEAIADRVQQLNALENENKQLKEGNDWMQECLNLREKESYTEGYAQRKKEQEEALLQLLAEYHCPLIWEELSEKTRNKKIEKAIEFLKNKKEAK